MGTDYIAQRFCYKSQVLVPNAQKTWLFLVSCRETDTIKPSGKLKFAGIETKTSMLLDGSIWAGLLSHQHTANRHQLSCSQI
ncbi:hypothetical protein FKM82_031131 [Ascaphus truei]